MIEKTASIKVGDVVYACRAYGTRRAFKGTVDKVTPTGRIVVGGVRFDKRGAELGAGYGGLKLCTKDDYEKVFSAIALTRAIAKIETCADGFTLICRNPEHLANRMDAINAAYAEYQELAAKVQS